MSKTPILCYHNIGQAADGRFSLLYVSPEKLDRQMWTLRRLGFRGVSMRDGFEQLRGGAHARKVILTFDDGYTDTLTHALPILKEHGFSATCYVVSDAIGTYNRWDAAQLAQTKQLMNRGQLSEWLDAGMEIGSHSRSHPRLEELDDAAAYDEIATSRDSLRRMFGVPVDHFAYPFGRYGAATLGLVRRAGYLSAVSLSRGVARPADPVHCLPRIFVNGDRGWCNFMLKVATPYEDLRHRRT